MTRRFTTIKVTRLYFTLQRLLSIIPAICIGVKQSGEIEAEI